MSWVSKHLGIRLDKSTLGNLAKNLSPVAGAAVGGPLGFLAAGALSAGGDLARGKDVSVGNALTNASLAGGLSAAKGALSSHGALGAASTGAPVANSTIATGGTVAGGSFDASTGALSRIGNGASGALKFAEAHPTATGGALNAFGNLATSGSENRLHNAEAAKYEQENNETQYDFDRRKEREAAYGPYWGALGTAIGTNLNGQPFGNVAPNPYTARS